MKIKRLDFTCFDDFSAWNDEAREHDADYNVVTVVTEKGWICCDLVTTCKSWKTALKRFFSVLHEEEFDSWYECMRETKENGYTKENNRDPETGDMTYSWEIEWLDDNLWYIFLNVRKEVA